MIQLEFMKSDATILVKYTTGVLSNTVCLSSFIKGKINMQRAMHL